MAKAAGPPDADGYRELDTEMVNLQEAGFFVFLLSFLQSMSDSASLWKKAVELFDQKMAEADGTIKGTGNIDNIGHGFWWAFSHGYFQGAVVATAMAIYEHKGEVFAKLVALGALLAVAQDTPIGWIADLFGGLVILEGVGSLLLAFKRVGGSNYVIDPPEAQRRARPGDGERDRERRARVRHRQGHRGDGRGHPGADEKFKSGGATEREAGRKAMEEPEEAGVGVSQPVEITDAARGAPSTKGKDAVAKAQKDELALKEEAADIAEAAKGAPQGPQVDAGRADPGGEVLGRTRHGQVDPAGAGRGADPRPVEGGARRSTFGEAVGEQLWSDRLARHARDALPGPRVRQRGAGAPVGRQHARPRGHAPHPARAHQPLPGDVRIGVPGALDAEAVPAAAPAEGRARGRPVAVRGGARATSPTRSSSATARTSRSTMRTWTP